MGGLAGVKKAIASKNTATVEFSGGLQVSGTFIEVIDDGNDPVYLKTSGPSALSINNVQLNDYGKEKFPNGLSIRIGKGIEIDNVIIYDLNKGDKIVSVFAGPADPEEFEPNVNVPAREDA